MRVREDLSLILDEMRTQIEKRLDQLVPEKQNAPYCNLFKASRYSLLNGGKRLRPILTLLTAEAFGAPLELALDAACSLEMIHCYSLIHDDLPCMDDDDYRRGKPSLHKAYNEGLAVLAADYLLTDAFRVIAEDSHLTPCQKNSLISLLAKNGGGEGMVAGQVMDIEAEGKAITIDQLNEIHSYKTGALIRTSIGFGGIISGASPEEIEILMDFGSALGLAYQIFDDILDVTASENKHGKVVSSDVINQKTTYVTLLGQENSRQKGLEILRKGCTSLSSLNCNTDLLQEFAYSLLKTHHA
jgi:geranylgeranyl diphosphate synthase type II